VRVRTLFKSAIVTAVRNADEQHICVEMELPKTLSLKTPAGVNALKLDDSGFCDAL
jgi:hypothetical protein